MTSISAFSNQTMGFRLHYKQGVESFYINNGNRYKNPHIKSIQQSISILIKQINLVAKLPILDFCAGGGEVSLALAQLNITNTIIGSDPYTYQLYEYNTGNKTYRWSFDDVMNCSLEDFDFNIIICSYALHLCPKEKLKLVSLELSKHCRYLGVITPFKAPLLHEEHGFKLIYTFAISKTKTYLYQSLNHILVL